MTEIPAPRRVGNAEIIHHEGYDESIVSPFVPAIRTVSDARLVFIEGTAYSWALEHPDQVLQAIDEFVCWNRTPEAPRRASADLSPRELEILSLLAKGMSSREIGNELVLTVRTVERHISNVYRKIGAHNRAQAAAYALEHRVVDRS